MVINTGTHVVRWSTRDKRFTCAWRRVELQAAVSNAFARLAHVLQGVFERVINFENRGLVTTSVAVVWCGEDSNNVSFLRPSE